MARLTPARRILFLQLPPVSADGLPARENHPLGAACLAVDAARSPLGRAFEMSIVERELADAGSDRALVEAIAAARPDLLGVTLYVWNVVRSLHIIREARKLLPELVVIAGGPEVVGGRSELFEWPLDLAVPGEGEPVFRALLGALAGGADPRVPAELAGVPGLLLPPERRGDPPRFTGACPPVASLDDLGSPYLEGWVDAAHDRFLYLETTRGCRFHCTFCRYDADLGGPLRTLSLGRVEEVLRHAAGKRVREVFLLDPTLNQRRDARELLRALARGNPDLPGGGKSFRYGGELVGELVDAETADLLAAAGFHTVEVGLQSTNPETLRRVERFHNRERFLRGVRLLKERGLRVRVDLIVGLPEETLASMKRAVDFVAEEGIGEDVQVFELMVLPGTALASQAAALGIEHLPRPPYTVVRTPTMSEEEIAEAVAYSEARLGVSWTPRPALRSYREEERVEMGAGDGWRARLLGHRRSFLCLDGRGASFERALLQAREPLAVWLAGNPFASVDVLLETEGPADLEPLERLVEAIQPRPETLGAAVHRRVWTLVPPEARPRIRRPWLEEARRLSLVRPGRRERPCGSSSERSAAIS
jgi:radical SAM superfamily enzyme YgiQ (UPF0313 family)